MSFGSESRSVYMLDGVDVCIIAPISQCVRGCLCLFVSLLVGVILLSMGGSPRLAARPPSPITRLPHPTHIIASQQRIATPFKCFNTLRPMELKPKFIELCPSLKPRSDCRCWWKKLDGVYLESTFLYNSTIIIR